MTCLLLLLAFTFCEPEEAFLVNQRVDNSVGLYFREYRYQGKDITTVYQLAASADLKDDTIDTLPMPLMVTINQRPYLVACEPSRCSLQGY